MQYNLKHQWPLLLKLFEKPAASAGQRLLSLAIFVSATLENINRRKRNFETGQTARTAASIVFFFFSFLMINARSSGYLILCYKRPPCIMVHRSIYAGTKSHRRSFADTSISEPDGSRSIDKEPDIESQFTSVPSRVSRAPIVYSIPLARRYPKFDRSTDNNNRVCSQFRACT